VHALGQHVHAADVQADGLRSGDGACRHLGCTSSVTSVAVPPVDRLALLRRMTRRPLAGTVGGQALHGQARHRDVIEAHLGQRGGMAIAAARILVDLVDQFAHGVHAVADHVRGLTARGCHQLVAHHQQAEVVPGRYFSTMTVPISAAAL
jgi:hypothetical protein